MSSHAWTYICTFHTHSHPLTNTLYPLNNRSIPSFAAFFTSHCSQVERDLRDGKLRLPRLDGGGRHPSYPPSRHPNHWHSHSGPSPQGPGRYGPPRFSRYEPSYMRPGGEGPGQEPRGLRPSDAYPGPQAARYDPESVPRSMSHGQSALQQGLSHQPALIGGHGPAATIPSSLLPGSGVQPTTAATAIGSTASRVMTSSSIAASSPPPKHYGVEQVQWGVRVDEFQSLSPFSKYVHPAAALHLQQLWDSESNKLVSVLNETSWEQLAGLDAASSVTAINEVVEAMKTAPDDIGTINALFLRTAAKFPKRPDAPTAASIAGVSGASGAVPLGAPAPAGGYATGTSAQPPTAVAQPQSGMASMYATPQVPSTYPQPSAGSLQQPEIHNRYPPTEPQIRLPGPCGDLSPALQAAIDRLLGQWGGLLKLDHFDDRVVDALSRMREPVAVHALEEFGHNDPTQMRNPTAYLLGCLRKYERRSASEFPPNGSGMEGGRGRGGRGRGRGGRGRVATPRYEPY